MSWCVLAGKGENKQIENQKKPLVKGLSGFVWSIVLGAGV